MVYFAWHGGALPVAFTLGWPRSALSLFESRENEEEEESAAPAAAGAVPGQLMTAPLLARLCVCAVRGMSSLLSSSLSPSSSSSSSPFSFATAHVQSDHRSTP